MRVSEDDGIHASDIFPQRLRPEIRPGVDNKSDLRRFNGAIAADHRDPQGGARAKKSQRELRVEGYE